MHALPRTGGAYPVLLDEESIFAPACAVIALYLTREQLDEVAAGMCSWGRWIMRAVDLALVEPSATRALPDASDDLEVPPRPVGGRIRATYRQSAQGQVIFEDL
jgi:hypothetical protein